MGKTLMDYRHSRDDLLATIVEALSKDDRFVAAWLTGSFSRNEADAVSDLDLTLVVSEAHTAVLCRREEQVSPVTTPERLELFSQFGTPAVIYENNHHAPADGTLTSIFYSNSALMVDWILRPQAQARRPEQAYMLFEKTSIPIEPKQKPESPGERVKKAAEIMAFFWMMSAVTAKYIIRQDQVFVTRWTEELHQMLREVERLVKGGTWEHQRGSLSKFEPSIAGQKQTLYQLGEWMEALAPELASLGGQVLPSPLAEIELLLSFAGEG